LLAQNAWHLVEIQFTCSSVYNFDVRVDGNEWHTGYVSGSGCGSGLNRFYFNRYYSYPSGIRFDDLSYADETPNADPGTTPIIDDPLENATLPAGSSTFEGKCHSSNLALSENFNTVVADDFDIVCANHAFTTSGEIKEGSQTFYIIDKDCNDSTPGDESCRDSVTLTGYDPDSQLFTLKVTNPELDNVNHAKVNASDEYPIQLVYSIPGLNNADFDFKLERFASSGYSDTPSTIYDDTLENADGNGDYKIGTFDDLSVPGWFYYKARIMKDGDDLQTVFFNIQSVDDDTGQTSALPGVKDLGFYGNMVKFLFVPNPIPIQQSIQGFVTRTQTAFPFAYLYQFKDQISLMSANLSDGDQEDLYLVVPLAINGQHQMDVPIIDTRASTFPELNTFIVAIRSFLVACLWFGFSFYIYSRVRDIEL